jgi:hypothetical protein
MQIEKLEKFKIKSPENKQALVQHKADQLIKGNFILQALYLKKM